MSSRSSVSRLSVFLAAAMALVMAPRFTIAQPKPDDTGYRTTEASAVESQGSADGYALVESPADKAADQGDLKNQGPVRMARFAYVAGNVTWRSSGSGDWSQAVINMPLRQGAEIMVLKGGRADIQFDDGSALRLGNGALVSLKTLYSDEKGEYTQIVVKDGLATLHSRHNDSVYQVDTPLVSAKTSGTTQIRFGIDSGSEVAVQAGTATLEGPAGKTTLSEGKYIYLASANSAYEPKANPAADTWDSWNTDRNKLLAADSNTSKHVPANIGQVAGDLDGYGTWRQDPKEGWVWSPNNQSKDWRPYQDGKWVWEDPFGWTWVSDEPWGWAPYHYGTWYQAPWGWSWCPGPYSQYWSPGVVSFADYGTGYCWTPLCPWEVAYPAFCGLGIWGAGWGFNFSIGWCGGYFPFGGGRCEGRRFDNRFCNGDDRFRGHGGFTGRQGVGGSGQFAGSNHGFVPFNASHNGVTSASREAFGGRGRYTAATNGAAMFGAGRTVGAPAHGDPVSGPKSAARTEASGTATRSFASTRPDRAAESRSTVQGSMPSSVARTSSVSAAEAARSARTSIGYTGSASGFSRSATSGSAAGRSSFEAGSTARSTYSGGFAGSSYGAGRSYGGYGGGSYRTPGYGGAYSGRSFGGYSAGRSAGGSSRGGGFSGGARSGGFSGGGHAGGGGGRR